MKKIALIGSTGSIGTQTLEIIRRNPDRFSLYSVVANSRTDDLKKQVDEFKPEFAGTVNGGLYKDFKDSVSCKVLSPDSALTDAVTGADVVVVACSGINGLYPTVKAIESGIDVALANKETLVTGGTLIKPLLEKSKSNLFPIDSEHSAVWQSLNGNRKADVKKIILTASGGAFRNLKKEEIATKKACDALKHPNWNMGSKITVDCATLMNKGLELIEAMHLFDVSEDKIDTVMHPESVIHSMVEYVDGAVIAELGAPTMLIPISYALSYPERLETGIARPDFTKLNLSFAELDTDRFPCLKIAREVAREHFSYAVCMNAANDYAVSKYLRDELSFYGISDTVKKALDGFTKTELNSVSDIQALHDSVIAGLSKR